jgi:hypothetical protein
VAIITNSIGSVGRDYSNPQSWIDAIPNDVVASGNSYVGECYNDSEFVDGGTIADFVGFTVGASNTITLKCAAGQSFRDHASVQTNGLRYNQANGVGLRCTVSSATVALRSNYITLDGLQIKCDGPDFNVAPVSFAIADNNVTIQNCIGDGTSGSSTFNVSGAGSVIRNCLAISRAGGGISVGNGACAYFCTIVKPSNITPGGTAISSDLADPTVQNCAIFGFTTENSGGLAAGTDYNCSDLALSTGSNNQSSKTYANQFAQSDASGGAHDFKIVTGSDCKGNGLADATNGANDIANTARPSGAAYDIGCWEFVLPTIYPMGQIIL